MTPEGIIGSTLTERGIGKKRADAAAEAIAGALATAGYLADDIETVAVCGSRPGIETTTVGGLTISLDAAGNAVEVSSPYGLEIVA